MRTISWPRNASLLASQTLKPGFSGPEADPLTGLGRSWGALRDSMITGTVTARDLELIARIRLRVKGALGHEREIEAIVDTGFTGALTLPSSLISSPNLAWRSRGSAILANGGIDHFDKYAATVVWDGRPRRILVESADIEPLVGMRLLRGYDLHIQVTNGGSVKIERLS